MEYTDKVLEHFMNPRNVGEIPNADGVGTIGSAECGDMLKVWIKVTNEHLADIKYKVFGCPAAIAACSMMTELAMGKHVDQAWELTDDQVAEALGGLPANKYHCSNLAASALHKAIMNYVFRGPVISNTVTITTLVDDASSGNLRSEHGLSLWIEYGDKRVLFDTAQSDLLLENAKRLRINVTEVNAIVISHGHHDHTGGLKAVLDIATNPTVYLHPAALEPKFARRGNKIKMIGMPDFTKEAIHTLVSDGNLVWTETPKGVFPGLFVTGQIPRNTDFEDADPAFFSDRSCKKQDLLPDDQAMFLETPKGLVVLLGCAHAGVVNTLNYVEKLGAQKRIYAVVGGMHLSKAPKERIEQTIATFREYDVQVIGLAHCTGANAVKQFSRLLPRRCFLCAAGEKLEI